ncbi:hypothetical protein IPJ72_04285 [Candidatus Peregrinibacteria bacterium]|nr:MAG: hypothetical protein IPJ72_04285 [Candidatus Peregrinibacteria bacterium]
MANLTEIKTGRIVKLNGDPYLVVWNQFNRKQQRKPVMRTKLKTSSMVTRWTKPF